MQVSRLVSLTALSALSLVGATHAVISPCCNSEASLTVLNSATGAIEQSFFTVPGTENIGFVLSKSGNVAYIVSQLNVSATSVTDTLASVNLQNGKVLASLSIPTSSSYPFAEVALSGSLNTLYVAYYDPNGATHIESVNPATLAVIKDSVITAPDLAPGAILTRGKLIYLLGPQLTVLRTDDFSVVSTIAIGNGNQLSLSPDGNTRCTRRSRPPRFSTLQPNR